MKAEHPLDADCVALDDFTIYKTVKQNYLPGTIETEPAYIRCPACRYTCAVLEFSEVGKCVCGLRMQVYGNALYCWKDKRDEG